MTDKFVKNEHDVTRPRYAVLVDAENAKYSSLRPIVEEVATLGGDASVRRVYGDFTKSCLAPYKQTSLELSFRPITAFSYVSGKGSSDAVMIIDAMDLLSGDRVDGFALVSSDSDFTPLAQRLREAGKKVIGFGQRHTPIAFVTACDRFIYTENLGARETDPGDDNTQRKSKEGRPAETRTAAAPAKKKLQGELDPKARELLDKVLEEQTPDVNMYVALSVVGDMLTKLKSDFDPRTYGYGKLVNLFQANKRHYEVKQQKNTVWVRRLLPPLEKPS
jgi:uncharacterized protein (TIGR00288 family)